jgi:hypothetical protein
MSYILPYWRFKQIWQHRKIAGLFAISGFRYNSGVVLRFENGTQAVPSH